MDDVRNRNGSTRRAILVKAVRTGCNVSCVCEIYMHRSSKNSTRLHGFFRVSMLNSFYPSILIRRFLNNFSFFFFFRNHQSGYDLNLKLNNAVSIILKISRKIVRLTFSQDCVISNETKYKKEKIIIKIIM